MPRWWHPRYRPSRSAVWLALIPLGLIAYLAYLGLTRGDTLAPFHVQAELWHRGFAGPFSGVVRFAAALPHDISALVTGHTSRVAIGDPLSWNAHDLIDLGFLIFACGGFAVAWRRMPAAYLAYAAVFLCAALSYPAPHEPLYAFPGGVLMIFPVFIRSATWLARRPRVTAASLGVSAAMLVALSGLWATWASVS